MKNITKTLFLLLAVVSFSCTSDDVEDRPVIVADGDAPVLVAPTSGSYVLEQIDAANQAERFVWTEASFGNDVVVNYAIELDKLGNDFAAPRVIASVASQTQASVSVETLNNAANALGAVPFEQGQYEVRVKASVNDTFTPLYSEPVTITITPYVAVTPELFIVGAVQTAYGLGEWDNTTALPMRYIGNGTTKVFEAYVKVGAGQGFKFIGEQGTWDNGNYGTIGGVQDGNLENGGGSGDIKVAENDGDGLYYVWVDIDNLEYKYVKMNWGIIGDATPNAWNGETPMVYDFANNKFTISTALTAGEMKFRAKNAGDLFGGEWKFNVGNSDPKVAYDINAGNFAITAGTYNLELSIGIDGTATVTGL